jgi:hypothetical protein
LVDFIRIDEYVHWPLNGDSGKADALTLKQWGDKFNTWSNIDTCHLHSERRSTPRIALNSLDRRLLKSWRVGFEEGWHMRYPWCIDDDSSLYKRALYCNAIGWIAWDKWDLIAFNDHLSVSLYLGLMGMGVGVGLGWMLD